MGVMDWIRPWRASDPGSNAVTSWPVLDYLYDLTEGKSAEDLWRNSLTYGRSSGSSPGTWPSSVLRRTRSGDGSRTRITSGPLALWLAKPNPDQTLYEFLAGIVGDLSCMTTPTSP